MPAQQQALDVMCKAEETTSMEEILTKEEKLILKEVGLSSTCIGQGLTILRKANFVTKWNYYQAFFLLTIGIERLLKLLIITKYRSENQGKCPQNSMLKQIGHDIKKLIAEVEKYDEKDSVSVFSDAILSNIIEFITKFAKANRYYNIDTITGSESEVDPLLSWRQIQEQIKVKHNLISEPPPPELIEKLSEMLIVTQHDEIGNQITDLNEFYKDSRIIDKIQGYSVFYFWKLIQNIAGKIRTIEYKSNMLPYLSEFFPYFISDWKKEREIIKIKNWNYL